MFQSEGSARSDAQNRVLAGYLASVAGFVNASGFLLIGSFTSHVTGNVGRFADDLVLGRPHTAVLAAALVAAFFAGAFVASMVIESGWVVHRSSLSGLILIAEAALLGVFMEIVRRVPLDGSGAIDAAAAVLCFAMGIQNSLVTRLSGAVVRTTHLTGVVTDLGIEAARWFRFWRFRLAERRGVRLTFSGLPSEQPQAAKTALLAVIFGSFTLGAAAGALATSRFAADAMLVPAGALFLGAAFAILSAGHLDLPGARR